MHLRVNRISPRMIHHIETHHMSQLQNSKLSAGKNSVHICFLMFWTIISNMPLVPGTNVPFFSSVLDVFT